MSDLPRLDVSREQAEDLASVFPMRREWAPFTVTVPERPMMVRTWGTPLIDPARIPIPVGQRVEVGFREPLPSVWAAAWAWHPVATATVAEVAGGSEDGMPPFAWHVTLTDIEAVS